jgi:hypothetical protein
MRSCKSPFAAGLIGDLLCRIHDLFIVLFKRMFKWPPLS